MNDSSFVCRQAVRDLHGVLDRLAHWKGTIGQSLAQRFSLEQLRHDVRRSGVVPDVEDRQDIRVVEGGSRARLQFETLAAVGVAQNAGSENLDGDVTSEPRIASPIHLAHRPGADRATTSPTARGGRPVSVT